MRNEILFILSRQILSNRPMSIAGGEGNKELETEWQQSEFVTDSLNWHNVYRQRHGAPPLTLCPQVSTRQVVLMTSGSWVTSSPGVFFSI
jgi:uncharacterized protein YkwD